MMNIESIERKIVIEDFTNEIGRIIESKNPLILIYNDIIEAVLSIWNYQVFVSGKEKVLFSNIIIGLVLFLFGLRMSKKISKVVLAKLLRKMDAGTAKILTRITHYFFILLVTLFVLDIVNVPMTIFTIVGTTLALGVGLGSQNIVNNFISGILIMIERPIKLGDIIEINHVIGTVMDIGARCVSLRTIKNITILIPNSSILQDTIINWTHDNAIVRNELPLRISNKASIEEVDKVLGDSLKKHVHILNDPAPRVLFKEITTYSYEIALEYWVNFDDGASIRYIVDDINRDVVEMLKHNNVLDEEVLRNAMLNS